MSAVILWPLSIFTIPWEVILCQFMIFLEQTFKLKKKHRKIFNVLAIAAFAHEWLFINRLYIQQ